MKQLLKRLPKYKTALAILFVVIQSACALYLPYITGRIVDNGIGKSDIGYIWRNGLVMLAFCAASLLTAYLNSYFVSKIAYRFGQGLRKDVYAKVLTFSKKEYDVYGASTLITRNTSDVNQVQSLIEMGLKFLVLCPMYLIFAVYLTWQLNPTLAYVYLGTIPLLSLAAFIIYKYASPLYEKSQRLLDCLNLLFREGLTGMKTVRAFSKETYTDEKYDSTNERMMQVSIKSATVMSTLVPVITLIMNLATVILLWFGGSAINRGTLEVGSLMGAVSYASQILMGFAMLTNIILVIPRARVSANRITEILDTPVVQSVPKQNTNSSQLHRIRLEDVGYRYQDAEQQALSDISLSVKPGETLAIIGGTGAGKTTLSNLLMGLYDFGHGAIFIDGKEIRTLTRDELNQMVSFVPQQSILFQGTIRSNLALGKQAATDEDMWQALKMAQADGFVRQLENGLDSIVDKAGGNFSGGQKQRLCIARALLKDAQIYVFDDAFSALDFKTDAAIRATLDTTLAHATKVIVAQRISTIMHADVIAVIDDGALVGLGTHNELAKGNIAYQEILKSQSCEEVA